MASFALLLSSCGRVQRGDLLEVPLDIHQNNPLSLSEIVEEVTAVELELTDKSLINTDYVERIIVLDNELIVSDISKIFVFSREGKFLRTIGSNGQGPGEYSHIQNLAVDEEGKRLFVTSSGEKIIVYDLNGKFLKETNVLSTTPEDINYIDGKLWIVGDQLVGDSLGIHSNSALYRMDDDLKMVDSCAIRSLLLEGAKGYVYGHGAADFILKGNNSVYLYYGEFVMDFNKAMYGSDENVLYDTLYQVKNKHLIPELKFKLKDNAMRKFVSLHNIYRSSRYVFAVYHNASNQTYCYFCYDTKTGKSYNMPDGYLDDIHQIEDPVSIRPFHSNTEMFYYLHTHMQPDDTEEPNPTLYLAKLKP
jgi:hypothetical protein